MTTISVTVGKIPGTIQTVELNGAHDVETALGAAGLEAKGFTVYVNNVEASASTELSNGDRVRLAAQIKGN